MAATPDVDLDEVIAIKHPKVKAVGTAARRQLAEVWAEGGWVEDTKTDPATVTPTSAATTDTTGALIFMALFFRRGKSRLYFCPAIANPLAPTQAELTAGKDLGASLSDMSGFQLSNSPIGVPNLTDTFTAQIDGEDTTADSTLTLYDDDTVTTTRAALAKGTNGFIVMGPYGSAATKRCEVWPVRSTGVNDQWTTANDPARFVVGFAITSVPKQAGTFAA